MTRSFGRHPSLISSPSPARLPVALSARALPKIKGSVLCFFGAGGQTGTMASDDKDAKTKWAEERTDWAEDRTVLANERTFAGWMRTGLAAVGIGLASQAIFRAAEPTWLAKLAATGFIAVGVLIFYLAWRNSCGLLDRLNTHAADPIPRGHLAWLAALFAAASLIVLTVLWLI